MTGEAVEFEKLNKENAGLPLEKITFIAQFADALLEFHESVFPFLRFNDQVELAVTAFLFLDFLLVGQVEKFTDKNH
jgi:hypothetical protein